MRGLFWTYLVILATLSAPSQSLAQSLENATVAAEYEVQHVETWWRSGVIVSTLTLELLSCVHGQCHEYTLELEVLGGERDGVSQVITGSRVPRVGERLLFVIREDQSEASSSPPRRALIPLRFDRVGTLRLMKPLHILRAR